MEAASLLRVTEDPRILFRVRILFRIIRSSGVAERYAESVGGRSWRGGHCGGGHGGCGYGQLLDPMRDIALANFGRRGHERRGWVGSKWAGSEGGTSCNLSFGRLCSGTEER